MIIYFLLNIIFLNYILVFVCFISATSGSLNVMGNLHQFGRQSIVDGEKMDRASLISLKTLE